MSNAETLVHIALSLVVATYPILRDIPERPV